MAQLPPRRLIFTLMVVAALVVACSSETGSSDAKPTPSPSPTPTVLTAKQKAAEKQRIAQAPTRVTAVCSKTGVAVSSPTVATRREGVLVIARRTRPSIDAMGYLSTPVAIPDQRFAGTIDFDLERTESVLAVPPGALRLTCLNAAGKRVGAPRTVTVYDRDGYYRSVNIERVLGCRPNKTTNGPQAPPRATSDEALDKLMETIPGNGTFTFVAGPGYPGSTVDDALVKRDGRGYGTAVAELQPNGSYIARLTSRC